MSEWLKERIAEQKASTEVATRCDYAAKSLFEELVKSCDLLSESCRKNQIPVQREGHPTDDLAKFSMFRTDSFRTQWEAFRTLTISLAKDRRSVNAKSDSGDVKLDLAFDTAHHAHVLYKSEPISTDEAAEILFDDFLFAGRAPNAFPTAITIFLQSDNAS